MNARQAAKTAAKIIENLEDFNRRASMDIKAYNTVIEGMIKGESPCPWCEDYQECQREIKDGKGCEEWWLRYETVVQETTGSSMTEDGVTVSGVIPE